VHVADHEADGRQAGPTSAGAASLIFSRGFAPFFFGNLLSNCGTWFQNIAQVLLVFRATGSSFMVGAVGFAMFGSVIFLSPLAGSAADRFDRRRLLIVTQVTAAAFTTLLTIAAAADAASTPVVLVLVAAIGAANAIATPAMSAIVPQLVAPDQVPRAIALHSVTYNLARAIGPMVGAAVIARFGLVPAFGVNALSYLGLTVALLVLRPRPHVVGATPLRPGFTSGIRLVRSIPGLPRYLLAVVAIALTADPVATLAPALAIDVFDSSESFVGLMIAAFGCGAVAAAALSSMRREGLDARLRLRLATLGIGIGCMGLAPSPPVALIALAIAGYGYLGANSLATSSIQLRIDDSQRGRVMAMWSIAFLGTKPISAVISGSLAELLGARASAVAMCLPAVAVAMWLRRTRSREPAAGASADAE
jgi:MFS family permease